MRLEGNQMQITTKWMCMKPITSSVSIIGLNLAVHQVINIFTFLLVMRVVVPQIVLNLISTKAQKISTKKERAQDTGELAGSPDS